MDSAFKESKYSSATSILSLPKEATRLLFFYISDPAKKKRIKKVCLKLKNIISDVISSSKLFIGKEEEILFLETFYNYGKVTAITMEKQSKSIKQLKWAHELRGKIFVVTYSGLHVYSTAKECWVKYSSEEQYLNWQIDQKIPSCIIGQKIITIGRNDSNNVELKSIKGEQNSDMKYTIAKTSFPGAGTSISAHTISNVNENTVIVAGGKVYSQLGREKSSNAYEGTLSNDGRNVVWKRLPSMFEARADHAAFNLDDSLYVLGGFGIRFGTILKSCEIFNLNTQIWTMGQALPCEMTDLFATTDAKKTFAIILGWSSFLDNKMKIIIFNKDDGFKKFSDISCTHTGFADICRYQMTSMK